MPDAYGQFSETEKFRKANEIEILYDTIDIDGYEMSKKLVWILLSRASLSPRLTDDFSIPCGRGEETDGMYKHNFGAFLPNY